MLVLPTHSLHRGSPGCSQILTSPSSIRLLTFYYSSKLVSRGDNYILCNDAHQRNEPRYSTLPAYPSEHIQLKVSTPQVIPYQCDYGGAVKLFEHLKCGIALIPSRSAPSQQNLYIHIWWWSPALLLLECSQPSLVVQPDHLTATWGGPHRTSFHYACNFL